MKYILTIDAGTTSVRAILYDKERECFFKIEKQNFKQFFPHPAWVEHDAEEIWQKIKNCILKVCDGVEVSQILGVGITNQRETTVAWDKFTGKPLYNAIVWQCRRTSKVCQKLKKGKIGKLIHSRTGLIPDAYFSATKMRWLIDNVKEVKQALEENRLCLGTIESYLVYRLTNGKSFVSDVTNASRTMLFNISTLNWDNDLLNFFNIPLEVLPKIVSNDEVVGVTNILGDEIKVAGLIGDQQSSLFGQGCFDKRMAKNTYGTGCFILVNTSTDRVKSKHGLLTTVAYRVGKRVCYALEGSVFNAGSVVDWAIDNLNIAPNPTQLTKLALQLESNEGVYVVPAFTGLGTPYWDMNARATISGMTRASDKRHIARAVLECMAYSTRDVLKTIEKDAKLKIRELYVDGGASQNDFLMQFQSNISQTKLKKLNMESTCMGAVYMTGLAVGAYEGIKQIKELIKPIATFTPQMSEEEIKPLLSGWKSAVKKCLRK